MRRRLSGTQHWAPISIGLKVGSNVPKAFQLFVEVSSQIMLMIGSRVSLSIRRITLYSIERTLVG